MAAAASRDAKDFVRWEGKDRNNGKQVRGCAPPAENQVQATLRRRGVFPTKIKKAPHACGQEDKARDLAIFTRQLSPP